ncbi:E3 ubiquitin-protein ligase RNF8-like isoform X1 [Lytechinus pictus]|uniref:E3 ubiquitin-protein ligase RNF8-like isoform X1 n=1 Tax=Lytechinus pictus TaxID=7653 RepID=UPI0030B9CB0E
MKVTVGRGMDVSIQLLASQNNLFLSRKHCTFKQVEGGGWTVIDNKSLNGVQINDNRVKPMEPANLRIGDKLELGQANKGQVNEFIFTVCCIDHSAEEVDKLLRAWKRRAEKIKLKLAAKSSQPMDSENSVKSDSQSGSLGCSSSGDRKRKERDEQNVRSSAFNEPSTSSDVKRTRLSLDGNLKNSGFRQLMEEVGANMTAEELKAITELLAEKKGENKGESVLERLRSTVKKQEEVEEKNAKLEVEYKTRVEEKEEELRQKDKELVEQKRLQEEAVEMQKRLLEEKEEALAKMKCEMEEVLEKQVKEKETALMEQLKQQREELKHEKEKVDNSLQEFSKQLAEKDRSMKEEQEEMQRKLEEAIREKEAQMLAQLEAEKQALIDEKQKVEEKLQTALEKDKGLEEEKQRLDDIIQQKEKEKTDMEDEMEASRLEREEEEKVKIENAKRAALDDFTNVMENEFQCSICSELFIQATTLNCSHSFCAYCIHTWFKRKNECPNCRVKTTSHSRSIVLDNYIDKMIEKLGDEAKQRRKEIVEERKGEDPNYSTRPNAGVTTVNSVPVVISDEEDEDEDEEDEEIEYYDRFDRFGRHGMRRYYHTSDEELDSENEDDEYY